MTMQNKILRFPAGTGKAQSSRETYRLMAADWNEAQGYTVLRGQDAINHAAKFNYVFADGYAPMIVIGKKNGSDNYDALGTILWDNEKLSTNGEWEYFSSLSNDPRFPDWKETYEQYGGVEYEEIEFPDAWLSQDEA